MAKRPDIPPRQEGTDMTDRTGLGICAIVSMALAGPAGFAVGWVLAAFCFAVGP